jgi:hypothetical protein
MEGGHICQELIPFPPKQESQSLIQDHVLTSETSFVQHTQQFLLQPDKGATNNSCPSKQCTRYHCISRSYPKCNWSMQTHVLGFLISLESECYAKPGLMARSSEVFELRDKMTSPLCRVRLLWMLLFIRHIGSPTGHVTLLVVKTDRTRFKSFWSINCNEYRSDGLELIYELLFVNYHNIMILSHQLFSRHTFGHLQLHMLHILKMRGKGLHVCICIHKQV